MDLSKQMLMRWLRGPTGILRVLCCLLVALLLGSLAGNAQTELTDDQFHQLTQRWHRTLDSISTDLDELTIVGDQLGALRDNIRIVAESAQEARDRAAAAAATHQSLLDALGPAPGDGEPDEDPIVATERSLIAARLSHDLGRAKRASVVLARVQSLLARAVDEETAALLGSIRVQTVLPVAPAVIVTGVHQFGDRLVEFKDLALRSWQSLDPTDSDTGLTLVAIVAATVLVGLPLRRWLLQRHGPDPTLEEPPTATRRFEAALAVAGANAALPALVIFAIQAAVATSPVVAGDVGLVVDIFLTVALETVPLLGLAFAVLAPSCPQWRISGLADRAANRGYRAVRLYAVLYLVLATCLVAISPVYADGGLTEIVGLRAELGALGGFVGVLLLGLATLNLLRPRNWQLGRHGEVEEATQQEPSRRVAGTLMTLVAVGVIAAMALAAFGYVNFAVFISRSMIRTLLLLGYALCLRILLSQGLRVATSAESPVGRWLRRRLVLDDTSAGHLVFWLTLTIDIIGGILVLATILMMWGLPGALLDQAADLALHGIDVGGFSISIIGIGLAAGVLVLSLTAVRLLQRFLADRVLVQTRLELGVRDALATGVSYVGYVIAILITLAALGLDVGNIALIFGALSVGIGFGLQHVVSNFVSGLILLIQRPIKTGDWIVVGDQQGYVKRISVISTEIQTFDAAAVIIPNSTMLSNQVINWHLHNKLGRVIVGVGASYDCDPEQVRSVLLACADQTPEILKRPAPQVIFLEFGDSALDFELRFFLREIDERLRVSSDLRFAIKKAFGEAGIEIPYPQRDVHLRGAQPPPQREPEGTG